MMKWTLILGLAVLMVLLNEHGSSATGLDSLLSDEDLQILKKGKLFSLHWSKHEPIVKQRKLFKESFSTKLNSSKSSQLDLKLDHIFMDNITLC